MEVGLNEHSVKADKVTKARDFIHQQKKSSQAKEFKSAIAEHATIENHSLDWDNAKKLGYVPDWRMRGVMKAITIRSTHHNFNHPQVEISLIPHVWDSLLPPCSTLASTNRGWERVGSVGKACQSPLQHKATEPH